MSIFDIISGAESSNGANVWGPVTSSGQAQGDYQITTGTWQQFAPQAGVSLAEYPTPNDAPASVQQQVASVIPLNRWAGSTVNAVENAYGNLDTSQTVGELASELDPNNPNTALTDPSGTFANPWAGTAGSSNPMGQAAQNAETAPGSVGQLVGGGFDLLGWFVRGVIVLIGIGLIIVGASMFKSGDAQSIVEGAAGAAIAPVKKAHEVVAKKVLR